MISDLDVNDPVLPRRRKVPRRFEEGNAPPEYPSTPKDTYRRVYFEALDLLAQTIQDRFDQPGYKMYGCIEALLLKVIQKEDYSHELKRVLEVYSTDLNASNLQTQLDIVSSNVTEEVSNIFDIIRYMQKLTPAEKELINEVITLSKLLLVMPATNSTSERSFSAMRRVKSYLRSTMTQERLNSLMVLHVHKDQTDKLDMSNVANEFVSKSERRVHVFGRF